MNNRNSRITMVVVIFMIVSITSGLIFLNQKTNAREQTEKQALIESVDKQHDLEEQAKALKADAPVITVTPARISPASPPEIENTTISTNTPNDVVLPTTPPQVEVGKATTTLSDSDIQRLQSYKQFDGGGSYVSFQDMYAKERPNCDALMVKFSAITLSDYVQAKAEWLTNPKLVYRSLASQYCIRGLLTLTYYSEGNKFNLAPKVKYQREVEYRLRNSVTDGKSTLKLESINYLSDFKAVE